MLIEPSLFFTVGRLVRSIFPLSSCPRGFGSSLKLKKVNYYLTKNSYEKLKDLGENKTFLEFENNEENSPKHNYLYKN